MFLLWNAPKAKPSANFKLLPVSPVLRAASCLLANIHGCLNFVRLNFSLNLTNCEKAASLLLSLSSSGETITRLRSDEEI